MIEKQGMRLARRAYLYTVFHIVFGAEPSQEEVRVLASDETRNAFAFAQELIASSGEALEPVALDAKERELAQTILEGTEMLLESLADKAEDDGYVESLKAEFLRLFVVPGSQRVHIWESPYVNQEAMLFQESTLDVRNRYREYGFEAAQFGHFPEDHLSMMLDFLGQLSSRAFNAFGDGEDDEVRMILRSQEAFISSHLMNWLDDFCDEVRDKDSMGVYLQFVEALQTFLLIDRQFVQEILSQESIL